MCVCVKVSKCSCGCCWWCWCWEFIINLLSALIKVSIVNRSVQRSVLNVPCTNRANSKTNNAKPIIIWYTVRATAIGPVNPVDWYIENTVCKWWNFSPASRKPHFIGLTASYFAISWSQNCSTSVCIAFHRNFNLLTYLSRFIDYSALFMCFHFALPPFVPLNGSMN